MPVIDINDVGRIGSVRDTPSYMLPPEAWSVALNMRVRDGGLEKLFGWTSIFGSPGVAPHFALPIRTSAQIFWLYVSLTKAYSYDGTTHTNITRQSAGVDVDYTGQATEQWNGTLLGGVPIINNGADVPQFWSPVALGTKLANLTNWPATLRAKVVRAFGPYLVVIYVTKAGVVYPHMFKWSHPADPGTVPTSWDETDPTKDCGEFDLPDVNAGLLVDCLPLGDSMFVYKDTSTWKIRFVGGRRIFDPGLSAWLTTSGILAGRCVAVTGDGKWQVVATQDDIIRHNGNDVQTLLTGRQRVRLFNEIDTTNYGTSFLFDNPLTKEVWFCYPGAGASQPDRALVINYGQGGDIWPITEADGITFRNAVVGPIESPSEDDWEANENLWDDDDGPWSDLRRRRVVLCGTDESLLFDLDNGVTRNGVGFTGTIQREGLALVGRKRNGDWIEDHQVEKLSKRIWPKIQGGPVNVRVGTQLTVNGAVTWTSPLSFDPSADVYIDPGEIFGRALAVEFSSTNTWRIDGFKYDIQTLGQF